jgi:HPt (histidine-containing phosphotransfer) domain-containing protein
MSFTVGAPARDAAVAPTEVLERITIDELMEALGDVDVRRLYGVLTAETTMRLDVMRRLSCEHDRPRLRDEAHTLKGAAGAGGWRELSELAAALERAAPTITQADYAGTLQELDESFARARAEIDRLLAGMAEAAA